MSDFSFTRRRRARHQPERLAVRELRRRVLRPQPKLRRQGRSQDELVACKARVQALQLNAVSIFNFRVFLDDQPPLSGPGGMLV